MTDYAVQRANMVESQIRPSDITDRRIIRAMAAVPRELYVPANKRATAYRDGPIPLDGGRGLMSPMNLARVIQLADIPSDGVVLEIGSGTGYGTAILASMAGAVVALESDPDLAAQAIATLNAQAVDNAVVVQGPLAEGYAEEGPYDAIVFMGSVPKVPERMVEQLKAEGRVVAIVEDAGVSRARIYKRVGNALSGRPALDASAPYLPGFEIRRAFSL